MYVYTIFLVLLHSVHILYMCRTECNILDSRFSVWKLERSHLNTPRPLSCIALDVVTHVKNACFLIKRSRYIHAWDMGRLHAEDKNLINTMAIIQRIHTNLRIIYSDIVHDSCTPGLFCRSIGMNCSCD